MNDSRYLNMSDRSLLMQFVNHHKGRALIRALLEWHSADAVGKDEVWEGRLAPLYVELDAHNLTHQALDVTSTISRIAEGLSHESLVELKREVEELIGGGKHHDRGRQAV